METWTIFVPALIKIQLIAIFDFPWDTFAKNFKEVIKRNFTITNSLSVFSMQVNQSSNRYFFAYAIFLMPPFFFLGILTTMEPQIQLCSNFTSTFLLDNNRNLAANSSIFEESNFMATAKMMPGTFRQGFGKVLWLNQAQIFGIFIHNLQQHLSKKMIFL